MNLKATLSENNILTIVGIPVDFLNRDADGITAISFDMAAAQAAALKEIGDYTGSYALRVSFVPTDGTQDLECAITFDSLVAE